MFDPSFGDIPDFNGRISILCSEYGLFDLRCHEIREYTDNNALFYHFLQPNFLNGCDIHIFFGWIFS